MKQAGCQGRFSTEAEMQDAGMAFAWVNAETFPKRELRANRDVGPSCFSILFGPFPAVSPRGKPLELGCHFPSHKTNKTTWGIGNLKAS